MGNGKFIKQTIKKKVHNFLPSCTFKFCYGITYAFGVIIKGNASIQ